MDQKSVGKENSYIILIKSMPGGFQLPLLSLQAQSHSISLLIYRLLSLLRYEDHHLYQREGKKKEFMDKASKFLRPLHLTGSGQY